MSAEADAGLIEDLLRKVYPDGRFVLPVEAKRPSKVLRRAFVAVRDRLAQDTRITIETEDGSEEGERCWRLYVANSSGPSWVQFNAAPEDTRRRQLRETGGSLILITIRISRLGPMWVELWNEFVETGRRVVSREVSPIQTGDWGAIRRSIADTMRSQHLMHVSARVAATPLCWLGSEADPQFKRDARAPTILEALFTDWY